MHTTPSTHWHKRTLPLALLALTALSTGCMAREVRFDSLENSLYQRAMPIIQQRDAVRNFDALNEQKDAHLAELEQDLSDIAGINEASVILMDNAAIVSINVDEGVGNHMLIGLRRQIEKTLKASDPSIKYVSVTSAPEMIERLHDITSGVYGDAQRTTRGNHERITSLRPPI